MKDLAHLYIHSCRVTTYPLYNVSIVITYFSQVPISRNGKFSVRIQRTIVTTYFFPTHWEYIIMRHDFNRMRYYEAVLMPLNISVSLGKVRTSKCRMCRSSHPWIIVCSDSVDIIMCGLMVPCSPRRICCLNVAWSAVDFKRWIVGNVMEKGKRKVGGIRHEARSCGRSSPDSLAFWACETSRR